MDGESAQKDNQQNDFRAPKDHYKIMYFCFVMVGAGFLTPWTSYIAAFDYFFYYYQERFPTVSVIIPISYLITTFFLSIVNVFLVSKVNVHERITFGYVMFVLSLLTIPLLDVCIYNCSIPVVAGFYITLLSVAAIGLGSGVQQSSYYGLTSMLPRRYTQAVMTGESLAGIVESGFRIITKATLQSERVGALVFFSLSLMFICVCFICHRFIRGHAMVRYYTEKCSKSVRIDVTGMNGEGPHEVADIHDNEPLLLECKEDSTDEEKGSIQNGADNLLMTEMNGAQDTGRRKPVSTRQSLQKSQNNISDVGSLITVIQAQGIPYLGLCWSIVKQIWPLMAAIFTCYFITLLMFPGILALVRNCTLGSWTPVLVIAVFNLTDFVAKWVTLIRIRWHPKMLLCCSLSRIVLVPFIILCVSPSPSGPVLSHNTVIWAMLFSTLLGLSNGYFGSLPLINLSPEVKREKDKELAGTIMTMTLLAGLLAGSVCAYAITPLTTLHQSSQQSQCYHGDTDHFNKCLQ